MIRRDTFLRAILPRRDYATQPKRAETRPSFLATGDVLVSRPIARADVYEISVVPALAHLNVGRYEDAMQSGRELARELVVNGWYTCDQTHFLGIARHRL